MCIRSLGNNLNQAETEGQTYRAHLHNDADKILVWQADHDNNSIDVCA